MQKYKKIAFVVLERYFLRYQTESNRRKRFCRPSPSHSAMIPCHWDCKNTTFFNIQTFFRKLFFTTLIATLNPDP